MVKTLPNTAKTVNHYLRSKLNGRPDVLSKASAHLIVNGGKRLRPYLVVKSCQMLGGSIKDAMPAAAAIEMVHNFTLVHDDITPTGPGKVTLTSPPIVGTFSHCRLGL